MRVDKCKMVYNDKTGKWYKEGVNNRPYQYNESCVICGSPYYTPYNNPSQYCSVKCCKNDPYFKKLQGDRMRLNHITMKERYGVEHISQLPSVKEKKGQSLLSFELVEPIVRSQGLKLIHFEPVNKHSIMTMECEHGHRFEMKYVNWQQGSRCRECYHDRKRNEGVQGLEGYKLYCKVVNQVTRKEYREYKHIVNPLNLKRGKTGDDAYHIDHKYSIIEGFKNNIDPKIIGSHHNLQMLTVSNNVRKWYNCSISIDELKERYYNE